MSDERPANRLLLTGASGCVGGAVLRRIASNRPDLHVFVAARRGSPPLRLPANARVVEADLDAIAAGSADLPAVDVVIHAAAVVHRPREAPDQVFRQNRDATLGLYDAAVRSGARGAFVFVSTVAAERETTPYGASKREAEELLLARQHDSGLPVRIVRLTTVYGPGDRGNIGRLFRAIAQRRYLRVAPADTRKSLLKADRAAAGLLAAAFCPHVPARTTLSDPRSYPLSEIEDAMCAVAGVGSPPRVPWWIARGLAGIGSAAELVPGLRAPFSRRVLQTLAAPVDFPSGPSSPITEAAQRVEVADLRSEFAIYRAGPGVSP